MKHLFPILRQILRAQRTALWRGAALSVIVLLMGVALLGLSGWFITAAAAAGLAGAGAAFDVFRPSAMVRFLALGRTAARYGERLLTHDAVLRALETLRLGVLRGMLQLAPERMAQIRGAQALNRLTADIDALDGLVLRLVFPLGAGLLALIISFAGLWWLVDLRVALWVAGGWFLGAVLLLWHLGRKTVAPSRRMEAATQALRSRFVDLMQNRDDLAVYGLLQDQQSSVLQADARRHALRRDLDRVDRQAGAVLMALTAIISGGGLWIGLDLAAAGTLTAAQAAIGFFAALALAEAVAPIRRALADSGRMTDAARRIAPGIGAPPAVQAPAVAASVGGIECVGLTLRRPSGGVVIRDFSLMVDMGETVALTGASGAGKSTLLLALAGLHPATGDIRICGRLIGDWPEGALRDHLAMLPQRSELLSGTVRENFALAAPDATEAEIWDVLDAVQLGAVLQPRGGLDFKVGARGAGLSGGEARRLALTRVLLRRPRVLLLDEPTEGLDEATATVVLAGIRNVLPDAAVLIASHRKAEIAAADRLIAL
ncbi:ATP-binding cassette domain-containing protein (plasmid) [Pseudorhodobacter turbinis]|uniref:ATP-binding cassette domain-containing protein n=1 Tax=Pseudorhodobacter turbinis TaxID=2500533 RepID=A0A4P8EKL5_9RHOB|nr:ATP-binding cassette domain-containing protein [Pseudorhodobacter turbinis]QCO57578.1 ATP-binding cassette domain-containing protein [Pseudorhodobacter turbinis]